MISDNYVNDSLTEYFYVPGALDLAFIQGLGLGLFFITQWEKISNAGAVFMTICLALQFLVISVQETCGPRLIFKK